MRAELKVLFLLSQVDVVVIVKVVEMPWIRKVEVGADGVSSGDFRCRVGDRDEYARWRHCVLGEAYDHADILLRSDLKSKVSYCSGTDSI